MRINPDEIFDECKSLLRSIGIPIASDDKLTLSLKLKSWHPAEGFCYYYPYTKRYEIDLKKSYFIHKYPDIKHLKSVIMHELVHTCPGCFKGTVANNHNMKFLYYANKIRKDLNYNIMEFERLSSYINGNKPVKVMSECGFCGCTMIYRSDKDILEDEYAQLVYEYDYVTRKCPYCRCNIPLRVVSYEE